MSASFPSSHSPSRGTQFHGCTCSIAKETTARKVQQSFSCTQFKDGYTCVTLGMGLLYLSDTRNRKKFIWISSLLISIGIDLIRKSWGEAVPIRVENDEAILTGDVMAVPIQNPTPQLSDHLDFAKKIITYVQSVILFTVNHLERSATIRTNYDPSDYSAKVGSIVVAHQLMRAIAVQQGKDFYGTKEFLPVGAKVSEKFNVGNCWEMSAVGHQFAKGLNEQRVLEGKEKIPVHVFTISNGDHVFLLVGVNNPSADQSTWSPDGVICDPWSGSCYPVAERSQHLRNYSKCLCIHGRSFTVVRPWIPSDQPLVSRYKQPNGENDGSE